MVNMALWLDVENGIAKREEVRSLGTFEDNLPDDGRISVVRIK